MKYDFSKLTERLSRINFAKIEDITKYDEKIDKPKYWYTQFIFGCILFSLINSGKISEKYVEGILPKNKKFSWETFSEIIQCINYQWFSINLWNKLSGNLVLNKEDYIIIRNNILRLKETINEKNIVLAMETLQLLKKKTRPFNLYNNGSWNCKKLGLNIQQTANIDNVEHTIKTLPKGSLICMIGHWQVFLGCKDNKIITINPQIYNDVSSIDFIYINEIEAFIVNDWSN